MYSSFSWDIALLIVLIIVFMFLKMNFKIGKVVDKQSVINSVNSIG